MNVLLQMICIILYIEPLKGNPHCKFCKHYVKPVMNENVYIRDYFGKCRKFFHLLTIKTPIFTPLNIINRTLCD